MAASRGAGLRKRCPFSSPEDIQPIAEFGDVRALRFTGLLAL